MSSGEILGLGWGRRRGRFGEGRESDEFDLILQHGQESAMIPYLEFPISFLK